MIWFYLYLAGVVYLAWVTIDGIKEDQDKGDPKYETMMKMASRTEVAIIFMLLIMAWPLTIIAVLIYWWSNAD